MYKCFFEYKSQGIFTSLVEALRVVIINSSNLNFQIKCLLERSRVFHQIILEIAHSCKITFFEVVIIQKQLPLVYII